MKIVYCSKTGHTKKYAQMLADSLKIESISVDDYKKDDEKIIYMGWISAGIINKYKIQDKSNIICTVAVGISYESEENNSKIIQQNNVKEEFFYLQGGLDYSKVSGFMRFMFKSAGKMMQKSSKDKDMCKIYLEGGDFIKEENLNKIKKYLKNLS